jgi:hypothetical protein
MIAMLLRKFGICVSLIAALALATFAGSASAQATPGTFYFQETSSGPDHNDCTGLSGSNTTTATRYGHFVGINGSQHVEATFVFDYRSDWSDGTYDIGQSTVHLEFETNSLNQAERTFAQQDRATFYTADGQVIGIQTVFTQGHITWLDGNIVSSDAQRRFTCA